MTIAGFVAYVKQLWKNKPDTSTPVSADRLTHVENGIKGNSDAIAKIAAAVVSQIVNDPNKIASMAALNSVNEIVKTINNNLAAVNYALDAYTGYCDIVNNSSQRIGKVIYIDAVVDIKSGLATNQPILAIPDNGIARCDCILYNTNKTDFAFAIAGKDNGVIYINDTAAPGQYILTGTIIVK